MRKPSATSETPPVYLPPLPSWVTHVHGNTPETVTFFSGASLSLLHMMLTDPGGKLPVELLRNRLALCAAEACLRLEGRRDSAADIRDAYYLTRAGDAMGPAGEMFARWRKAGAIGLKRRDWLARLKACVPEHVAASLPEWVDMATGQGGSPVAQAARITGFVVEAFAREETTALICGDVVLARALGWTHPLPLLGMSVRRKDVRNITVEACHLAAARSAESALRLGHDLTRRAERLRAIAPKLRAKGAEAAVALFLREDAVLPSTMLSPRVKGTSIPMTPRAARRLCDRLVELDVVRELTGRSTFRLYGVGS